MLASVVNICEFFFFLAFSSKVKTPNFFVDLHNVTLCITKGMTYACFILVGNDNASNGTKLQYFSSHENRLGNLMCYEFKPELVFISICVALHL